MEKWEQIELAMKEHEKKDDERFKQLNKGVSDIHSFTKRLEPLIFPEPGSGLKPPLEILANHEKFKQRVYGAFWIIGTLFVALTTIIGLIYFNK